VNSSVRYAHDIENGGELESKQLGAHRSQKLTGIAVGNNGSEVVDLASGILSCEQRLGPLLVLPPVVVKLGPDKLVNLVGDCVHRVVGKVRSRLVRS